MIHTRDQYSILFSARSSIKRAYNSDLIILKGFCFNFFGISYLFIHFSSSFYFIIIVAFLLLFALANNNRLSGIPMNFNAFSWSIYYSFLLLYFLSLSIVFYICFLQFYLFSLKVFYFLFLFHTFISYFYFLQYFV